MSLGDNPVYPTPWEDKQEKTNGITLRQEFSKAAMNGMISDSRWRLEEIPEFAVIIADAVLKELEKPPHV